MKRMGQALTSSVVVFRSPLMQSTLGTKLPTVMMSEAMASDRITLNGPILINIHSPRRC